MSLNWLRSKIDRLQGKQQGIAAKCSLAVKYMEAKYQNSSLFWIAGPMKTVFSRPDVLLWTSKDILDFWKLIPAEDSFINCGL